FSVTETGIPWVNANTSAVWYAGMLGEFMRHPEMELFSPWSWQVGMWEVLHLYARYNNTHYLEGNSSDEVSVSAYPTINEAGDSVTLVLVNRAASSKATTVNFAGFDLANQSFDMLRLSNLTNMETFTSHTANALQESTVTPSGNALSLTLPSMSITTILIKGVKGDVVTAIDEEATTGAVNVYPNPINGSRNMTVEIRKPGVASLDLMDVAGQTLKHFFHRKTVSSAFREEIDLVGIGSGVYMIRLQLDSRVYYRKVVISR